MWDRENLTNAKVNGTECEGCPEARKGCPFAGRKAQTKGSLKDMSIEECAETIRKAREEEISALSY